MAGDVNVQVKLFGHLRQFSSQQAIELQLADGSTVADLIGELANLLGSKFTQALLDARGNLHGGIEVVLNEEHLPARKIQSILLPQDSTVYLVPMIEGGSYPSLVTSPVNITNNKDSQEAI